MVNSQKRMKMKKKETIDAKGKMTISKGGTTKSKNFLDPDSDY